MRRVLVVLSLVAAALAASATSADAARTACARGPAAIWRRAACCCPSPCKARCETKATCDEAPADDRARPAVASPLAAADELPETGETVRQQADASAAAAAREIGDHEDCWYDGDTGQYHKYEFREPPTADVTAGSSASADGSPSDSQMAAEVDDPLGYQTADHTTDGAPARDRPVSEPSVEEMVEQQADLPQAAAGDSPTAAPQDDWETRCHLKGGPRWDQLDMGLGPGEQASPAGASPFEPPIAEVQVVEGEDTPSPAIVEEAAELDTAAPGAEATMPAADEASPTESASDNATIEPAAASPRATSDKDLADLFDEVFGSGTPAKPATAQPHSDRQAILQLARALDEVAATLHSLSRHLTEMARENVAGVPSIESGTQTE